MMKAAVGKSMAAFVIVEKKNIICYNSRKDVEKDSLVKAAKAFRESLEVIE